MNFFQGDGAGDSLDAGAVAPQVLTYGSQATAEKLYQRSLSVLHGQKASRAYRTSEANAAQHQRENTLLDNIASVMSGNRPVEVVILEEDEDVGAANSIATGSNNNVARYVIISVTQNNCNTICNSFDVLTVLLDKRI